MGTNRYDLEVATDAFGTAQLHYVSSACFEEDWHSCMHAHTCTELFFCVHGVGQFVFGSTTHQVGNDDLILVNANVKHTERSLATNPLEYIVLGIEGIDFLFKNNTKPYMIYNLREMRSEILFYLREIMREADEKRSGYKTICQYLMQVLLIKLTRNQKLEINTTVKTLGSRDCVVVHRYIDQHFSENLSLDVLAQLTHVNKYHLAHTFSKDYGVTPIQYLLQRRLRESEYMLSNTDHPLAMIANWVGFSSPSYFAQTFRKAYGISPTQYRKNKLAETARHERRSKE